MLSGNGDSGKSPIQAAKRSVLTLRYEIFGDRRQGAHTRIQDSVASDEEQVLEYSSTFVLKMPVLEQLVALGMLPVPSQNPRVGQQVVFQWRIERLKEGRATPLQEKKEANPNSSSSLKSSVSVEQSLDFLTLRQRSNMGTPQK